MKRSLSLWIAVLILLTITAMWVAMGLGSSQGRLTFDGNWFARLFEGDELERNVLLIWRGPRVVAAAIVGLALAVAGLLLQGTTRNPLADPYLLGISGGAGLFVVLVRGLNFFQTADWWLTPIVAFCGAMIANFLVLTLARGTGGRITVLGLILGGVIINAFCAALMTFLLARFDPFRLRVTTLWLAGGIGFARWSQLAMVGGVVLVAWVFLRSQAHKLNAFALGTEDAASVGVDTDKLLLHSAVWASLLSAIGVSLAGLLGYVGLIVPHGVRMIVGHDFRVTLPLSGLAGALLLVLADIAARTLFAPEELPTGVITALLGCPVLLILLRAQLRGKK
ncbi:MAG: iron ABC transporter permease [Pseudomonadota bacterium]